MAMRCRRAQAHIDGEPDARAEALFDRSHLPGGERPVDIVQLVCRRHAEQQELADASGQISFDLLQQRGGRVAIDTGEARYRFAVTDALDHEQWLDELFRMWARTAGEGADVFILPQATKADLAHARGVDSDAMLHCGIVPHRTTILP